MKTTPYPWTRTAVTVLLAVVVLSAVAVAAVGRVTGGGPTSNATLAVTGQPQSLTQDNAYTASQYVTQRMLTYTSVATSDDVLTGAAALLGETPSALSGAVAADVPLESSVIELSVTGSTPEQAQRRAGAVVTALIRTITTLESPNGENPRVVVSVISAPDLPAPVFVPSSAQAGALGAVAGVLLGLVADLVLRSRRRREGEVRDAASGQAEGGRDAADRDTDGHRPDGDDQGGRTLAGSHQAARRNADGKSTRPSPGEQYSGW